MDCPEYNGAMANTATDSIKLARQMLGLMAKKRATVHEAHTAVSILSALVAHQAQTADVCSDRIESVDLLDAES